MKTILIILLIILVCGVIINWSIESNKKEIIDWATKNNMEVKSIDTHMTIIGTPFYYLNRGQYIYEVDMMNGEKWWVRSGIFGNDYEKDKP